MLLGVEPVSDWYSEKRLKDPTVLELARKVILEVDGEAEEAFPSRMLVKMELTARGSHFGSRIEFPKGEPENPLTQEDLVNKFRGLASKAISAKGVEELIEVIQKLEDVEDIRDLTVRCVVEG